MSPTVPARLLEAATDTERHVARFGWDQPARLFALVRNAELLAHEPTLRTELTQVAPDAYSAVEQEGLPPGTSVEELLGQIAWPDEVDGALLAVERIVVSPDAERDLPGDERSAVAALAAHPSRRDIRLVVAVLRDGSQVTLLRQREHDRDDDVAVGTEDSAIAPGLVAGLLATFAD